MLVNVPRALLAAVFLLAACKEAPARDPFRRPLTDDERAQYFAVVRSAPPEGHSQVELGSTGCVRLLREVSAGKIVAVEVQYGNPQTRERCVDAAVSDSGGPPPRHEKVDAGYDADGRYFRVVETWSENDTLLNRDSVIPAPNGKLHRVYETSGPDGGLSVVSDSYSDEWIR